MAELTLTIKCSNASQTTVTITDPEATVLDLKAKISEVLSVPSAQQRLIYKGRVLKDESTLRDYDIQDGHTVHMVKGVAPTASSATPPPPAAFSAPPVNNLGALFGNSAAAAGNTTNNPLDPTSRMHEQLLRNPEMMQQIMSSPMMENLLNNPDMIRNMMMNNPQMQQMLDSNPQMRHILNDPAVLRQSMEMMRNPHALQQAMRNQDLQMSHIENIPGGFNALRRMYEEVHEPMMEATQSMAMGASTAGSSSATSSTASSSSATAAAPTNSALPNPWGQRPSGSTNDAPHPNPFGAPHPNPFGASMFPGGAGLPSMDPAQMNAMMQNPMMQQMMQQMLQDPNALEQVAMLNPQLGTMLRNPQMRSMLSSPEFIQSLSNPAVMQAMMNQSRTIGAQSGLPPFGLRYPMPFLQPPATATTPPVPPSIGSLNFDSLFVNEPSLSTAAHPPAPSPVPIPQPPQDPAVRFASQLQQLQDMGFADGASNLQALIRTNGNVNAAVERLLSGP